jgi:hypothetical protein
MNVYSCGWIQFGGTQKIMELRPSRRRKNLGLKCHRGQIFDRTNKTIFAAALGQYYFGVQRITARCSTAAPGGVAIIQRSPDAELGERVRNGRANRTQCVRLQGLTGCISTTASKVEKKAAF